MLNRKLRRGRAVEKVEDTATYLIWKAECFSSSDVTTLWDKRVKRRELLEAARNYASAVRRLVAA